MPVDVQDVRRVLVGAGDPRPRERRRLPGQHSRVYGMRNLARDGLTARTGSRHRSGQVLVVERFRGDADEEVKPGLILLGLTRAAAVRCVACSPSKMVRRVLSS